MPANNLRLSLICSLLIVFRLPMHGQATDSVMKEQLTRAVQLWKQGNALLTFRTLDSILDIPTTSDNAGTKSKAAVWTATYLAQQKKLKASQQFTDSALRWSKLAHSYESEKKALETAINLTSGNGNYKSAFEYKNLLVSLEDSILTAGKEDEKLQLLDSIRKLQKDIEMLKTENKQLNTSSDHSVPETWLWSAGVIALILIAVIFQMNAALQRLKHSPPLSGFSSSDQKPKVKAAALPDPEINFPSTETDKDKKPATLTARLSEVELVLIKASSVADASSGDVKAARSILSEYLHRLPVLMKQLDDAVTENKNDVITEVLSTLKPYLSRFGMDATVLWIDEINTELPHAKLNKVLSRIFQVRNHCRRAADEAKSILERF